MPLAGTIASYVLSTGKPWAGTRDQACANFQSQILLKEQFSSGCMLPLSGRNGLSARSVFRAEHNPYRQDELDFLGAFPVK